MHLDPTGVRHFTPGGGSPRRRGRYGAPVDPTRVGRTTETDLVAVLVSKRRTRRPARGRAAIVVWALALARVPVLGPAPGAGADGGVSFLDPGGDLDAAIRGLGPGSTLVLRGGDYPAVAINDLVGRAEAPIVIAGADGQRPVIHTTSWGGVRFDRSEYVELRNVEVAGTALSDQQSPSGIEIDNSHHIRILANVVHDVGGGGISSVRSNHLLIEGNEVFGTAKWSSYQASAISLYQTADIGGGPGAFGISNLVIANHVHDNTNVTPGGDGRVTDGNCIIVDSNQDTGYPGVTYIANNLCVHNGGRGINVMRSDRVMVFNNTLVHNLQHPDLAGDGELSALLSGNVLFRNNLVVPLRAGRANNQWSSHDVIFQHNVYVDGSAQNIGAADQLAPDLTLLLGIVPAPGDPVAHMGEPDGAPAADFHGQTRSMPPAVGALQPS
jgi:hypothetical protein